VDAENGTVNLLIKRQVYESGAMGAGSYFLTNEENLGQEVCCHILPPLNFKLPKDKDKPILLLASANGIAPYIHFLSELNKSKFANQVCLVYLTRSEKEDWLEMQLKQNTQLLPNFQCCVIYTGKNKRVEWLTKSKIASVNSSQDKLVALSAVIDSFKLNEFFAYVCGSISFTKALLGMLNDTLGQDRFSQMVGNSQLAYEAFSFTEAGDTAASTLKREFTLEEINKHNTKTDCWVTLDGNVYDITRFLDIHKAGGDVFLSNALVDRDMTATYRVVHKGISPTADSWLQSYHIGQIKLSCPFAGHAASFPAAMKAGTCPYMSQKGKANTQQVEKLVASTPKSNTVVQTSNSLFGLFRRETVAPAIALGVLTLSAYLLRNYRA
jgi:cytochrome b involved in lipid metabolism